MDKIEHLKYNVYNEQKIIYKEKNMLKKISGLFIVLMFAAVSVFAQTTQELRVGSSVSGNLSAYQEIWYSVRTTQAGFLEVKTTGGLDTCLEAFDAQRNFIAENDDWEDFNARIEFLVQANTTYLFKLYGYSDSSGQFVITASHKPMPSITELRSGSYNGNFGSEQERWFSFTVSRTGILTVETQGDLDTVLEAYNKDFVYITGDDDSGDSLNASISLGVKTGETYYYKLRTYGHETGPYSVSAIVKDPVQLAPGSFINGNINNGEETWYSVRTTRRGQLTVETTGSTDTVLTVYTDEFGYIYENDDNEDYNARIVISVEPNTTHFFKLTCYSSGPYRIFAFLE